MLAPLHKVVFPGWAGNRSPGTRNLEVIAGKIIIPIAGRMSSMRSLVVTGIIAALALLLVLAAGCTTTQNAGTAPAVTGAEVGQPAPTSPATGQAATPTVKSSGIDTTVNVHFNDYACLDIQKELGVEYLYPDQKLTIGATSPGSGTVNVNVLLLDVTDNMRLRQIKPSWDIVKKSWVYEGIVPIIQFNDITTPQEKTVTIKDQGKYYLCVDDRKETGTGDAYYKVPVRITRT